MQPVIERFSKCRTSFRITSSLWCGAVLISALYAVAGAAADVQQLYATQDQTHTSMFTLDFGAYGSRSADITTTEYTLEADPVAQTARFLTYHQTVDPLELPGGISTGDMIVTIKDSLAGPYDPASGMFTTQDTYLIYFTGDLSAYGLTSPVALPGSAGGAITYTSDSTGTIVSGWAGQGQLNNPTDPEHPIVFNYDCASAANFTLMPEPGTLALLGLGLLFAGRCR